MCITQTSRPSRSPVSSGSPTTDPIRLTLFMWAPRCSRTRSELDLPDGVLDLADDRVAEVLAAVRLVALHRRHHARHHERDEQDQRHVLDRALPDLPGEPPPHVRERVLRSLVHRACRVHRGPPKSVWLTISMLRRSVLRLQTWV